jgi:hypothetical protein
MTIDMVQILFVVYVYLKKIHQLKLIEYSITINLPSTNVFCMCLQQKNNILYFSQRFEGEKKSHERGLAGLTPNGVLNFGAPTILNH